MSRRRPLRDEGSGEDKRDAGKWCSASAVRGSSAVSMGWLAVPWHLCMVVFYSLLLYHGKNFFVPKRDTFNPKVPGIPSMGGRFKYLTHINEWVQLVFFSFQLLVDVTPCRYKKNLQKVSSFLFTTLAFPLCAFIVVTFWGLYAIDRELVYPEALDKFIPGYMNQFWHTTIVLWVLCEVYLVLHEFPTKKAAACSTLFFGSIYNGWIIVIFIYTNWWVYPFMRFLSPAVMALFLGSSMFVFFGFHLLGKKISYHRWGTISIQN